MTSGRGAKNGLIEGEELDCCTMPEWKETTIAQLFGPSIRRAEDDACVDPRK
jgi:hypothetical protein